MTDLVRKAIAEFVGSAMLVIFAVGAAIFGLKQTPGNPTLAPLGVVGVALAFGLTLLALAYAIGPVSGCHINPAVTLGVLMRRGMPAQEAVVYWVAQFVGGIVGAAVLQLLLSLGKFPDTTGGKGANNWSAPSTLGGVFLLEVLLTFLLVIVVLLVTARSNNQPGFAGLAIGLALVVCHLVGIPIDGTSVNPARSLGPALFAGGEALSHVWVFLLAPLAGGAVAALLAPVLTVPGRAAASTEDTGAKRDKSDAGVPGGSSAARPRPNRPGQRPRR